MKARVLQTKFWEDSYVTRLDIEYKLLFAYLLTNQYVGLTGIYEVSDRRITFETGLDETQIDAGKQLFNRDKKFLFFKDWVCIVNAQRYQRFTGIKNDIAAVREFSQIPAEVVSFFKAKLESHVMVEYMNTLGRGLAEVAVDRNEPNLKEIAKDFNLSSKDVENAYEKWKDYKIANGKTYANNHSAFKVWIRTDVDSGKLDMKNRQKHWEDMNDLEKQKVMNKCDSGIFDAGWTPPPGTPEYLVEKFKSYNR